MFLNMFFMMILYIDNDNAFCKGKSDGGENSIFNRWIDMVFLEMKKRERGFGGRTWCVLKRRSQTLFSLSNKMFSTTDNKKDVSLI